MIYISGPMTGMPDHNYPLFNLVAAELRMRGHEVINPAELDALEDVPGSMPWEWYLRRDLKAMLDCDTLVLLPEWRISRGAKLEVYVANKLKMNIYEIDINDFKLKKTRLGNKESLIPV